MIGTVLSGRYRVVRKIGEAGTREIYLSRRHWRRFPDAPRQGMH